MQRVSRIKSLDGAELLVLVGKASWSVEPGDSNVELKAMHHMHDEAIRAVRDQRDFIPYKHSAS